MLKCPRELEYVGKTARCLKTQTAKRCRAARNKVTCSVMAAECADERHNMSLLRYTAPEASV